MRRRMYFVLPNMQRVKSVYRELALAQVEERHVHVLAKEGTPLEGLPEATVLQKSDATRAVWLGVLVGALAGLVAGAAVLLIPPSGFAVGLGVVVAMTLLGAVMGVWVAGMIGSSTP